MRTHSFMLEHTQKLDYFLLIWMNQPVRRHLAVTHVGRRGRRVETSNQESQQALIYHEEGIVFTAIYDSDGLSVQLMECLLRRGSSMPWIFTTQSRAAEQQSDATTVRCVCVGKQTPPSPWLWQLTESENEIERAREMSKSIYSLKFLCQHNKWGKN